MFRPLPNRGRQWRAQRSCASPLHAGLDRAVEGWTATAGIGRKLMTAVLGIGAGTVKPDVELALERIACQKEIQPAEEKAIWNQDDRTD